MVSLPQNIESNYSSPLLFVRSCNPQWENVLQPQGCCLMKNSSLQVFLYPPLHTLEGALKQHILFLDQLLLVWRATMQHNASCHHCTLLSSLSSNDWSCENVLYIMLDCIIDGESKITTTPGIFQIQP